VQNSGGLLPGVPENPIDDFLCTAEERKIHAWQIGEAIEDKSVIVEK